ncbi:MAG: NifU family protein [Spirochaetaceae bacterium]|nr:NifU family protein [Spirochaetaceae bacterium]
MSQNDIQVELDKVRPHLQNDGGDVQIVRFDGSSNILYVELQGACKGCPHSQMTIKNGIERYLKSIFPDLVAVEAA